MDDGGTVSCCAGYLVFLFLKQVCYGLELKKNFAHKLSACPLQ